MALGAYAGTGITTNMGVNGENTQVICMMAVSLITGCVICFIGTIGFICLGLVSHYTHGIGRDHKFLLPAFRSW